jgi:hypothetical protein
MFKVTFVAAIIFLDGWLDLAVGCWDKVVDRQTLNGVSPSTPDLVAVKNSFFTLPGY